MAYPDSPRFCEIFDDSPDHSRALRRVFGHVSVSLTVVVEIAIVIQMPGSEGVRALRTKPTDDVVELYTKDVEFAMEKFQTSREGLSSAEAARRSEIQGKNKLEEEPEDPLYMQFLKKFTDPMVVLLLISAVISILMRQYEDAASIILAVTIVSTVGFVQEYKSERAVDALKEFVAHRCIVVRDGKTTEMLGQDLVTGDVITLGSGGRVPADIRLIEACDLTVNESLLTGENEPVRKHCNPIDEKLGWNVAERKNMCSMGTTINTGVASGIVTAIGTDTELGQVSAMLQHGEKKTPLQLSMDHLGKQLSIFSLAIIVVISLIGFLQGKHWLQMFNIGVSLAVAAIPEGLPIAVTVTLALGVTRMSRRNAIVRKLPAVEALGATNVICVDKTGTLTENRMTAIVLLADRPLRVVHEKEIAGNGLGIVRFEDDRNQVVTPEKDDRLKELLVAGVLCNNTQFNDEALDNIIGQPTEGALLRMAFLAGLKDLRKDFVREEEIPFDSEKKWMGCCCNIPDRGSSQWFVKGAVEVVLGMCVDSIWGAFDRSSILEHYHGMASRSLRVVAVAAGMDTSRLTFLGLVGFSDPPRAGVQDAIRNTQSTGIHIAMITGDSRPTAVAVAKELGLTMESPPLSSMDIENMSGEELASTVGRVSVFYRMSPGHKMKIVNAYQEAGKIVAMTGDGVNDAPALSRADIGIAMGKGGSDVCKEAAEIILVDNNFSTIVAAIEEGKIIFNNIKNFLHFQLTTSVAAMGLIALCAFLDLPLALNTSQILWINIIMDGPPAQSLTFESFREAARSPPRKVKDPIVDKKTILKIIFSSMIMVFGTLYVFLKEIPGATSVSNLHEMEEAPRLPTTMAFTTFVLFQLFNAFNCRSLKRSVFTVGLFSNHYLMMALGGSLLVQLLVVYLPPLQLVFHTVPLSFVNILWCLGVASTVWLADEFWKLLVGFR